MIQQLPPKPRFQRLLHDSLVAAVHDVADKLALITEKGALTYLELFEKVQRCAAALVAFGLRRGDRVVIFSDNTSECVSGIWATLWAGGVFVTVNPQTKTDKLKYIIQKSGARILITDEHLWPQFAPVLSESRILDCVLCCGAAKRSGLESIGPPGGLLVGRSKPTPFGALGFYDSTRCGRAHFYIREHRHA
jgi:non-ribosomal peptide synthetase component F